MSEVQISVVKAQDTQIVTAVPGIQGPVGPGVPSGGTTNQVLFKASADNYDTAWSEVTSAMIGDLEIVNADVATNAAIALSKLATGALPSGITVASTNIVDGTIVNADINASAAIVDTKLATIATGGKVNNSATTATSANTASAIVARDGSGNFSANTITANLTGTASAIADNIVTSAKIVDGAIVNADINASAGIAGTKIAPDFGSQTVTTTGIISPALGTAAAPSIAFTGDLNTGIFSPGADQVAVATNGTGRLFVDASGRLLLGTSTAASLAGGTPSFYVEGTSASTANGAIVRTNGASTFSLGRGSSGNNATSTCGVFNFQGYDGAAYGVISSITATVDGSVSSGSTPGTLVFNTTPSGSASPTERLRITSAGLVGIGTSSPNTLLQVQGGVTTDTEVNYAFFNGAGSSQPGIYIGGNSTTSSTGAIARYGYIRSESLGGTARALYLQTGTDTRVVIDNTGKVGIGITSPDGTLHVHTASAGTVTPWVNADDLIVENNGPTGISILAPDDGQAQIIFGSPSDNIGSIIRWKQDENELQVGTHKTEGFLTLKTAIGQERARIDSSGRLLVGTSSAPPAVETLTPGLALSSVASAQDGYTAGIYCYRNAGGSGRQTIAPRLFFARSRSGVNGSVGGIVIDNEDIGNIRFAADDGTQFLTAAEILAEVDGTPGANDMPGRLVFSVTADGASSPTEALRISNNRAITVSDGGNVVLGTTTGTKIGTATTQKLGFYNATPVVQPAAVADATTAVDVITQLNDLLAKLRTLGIIAT